MVNSCKFLVINLFHETLVRVPFLSKHPRSVFWGKDFTGPFCGQRGAGLKFANEGPICRSSLLLRLISLLWVPRERIAPETI